jgi:hypothetical protein
VGDAEHFARRRWRLGRFGHAGAEVVEDLADRHLVAHEGDETHALAAASAGERVDVEDLAISHAQLAQKRLGHSRSRSSSMAFDQLVKRRLARLPDGPPVTGTRLAQAGWSRAVAAWRDKGVELLGFPAEVFGEEGGD